MSWHYRAWLWFRRHPGSPQDLALALGIKYTHACTLVKLLRTRGHIALAQKMGRSSIYQVTDTPCPPDRTKNCGPRRTRRSSSYTPVPGYGAGRIALEECWKPRRCPHGNLAGECNACDVAGDFAFDAAREGRMFR